MTVNVAGSAIRFCSNPVCDVLVLKPGLCRTCRGLVDAIPKPEDPVRDLAAFQYDPNEI